jgi:predicted RNA-binding protein with TRAM domain
MYGGDFRRRPSNDGDANFAPVKVGEELDVKIEAVGEKGDGIARKKGFVLFVPSTQEGQEVRIRVTKVLRKVGFAEAIGPAQGAIVEDSKPARTPKERPSVADDGGQPYGGAPESEDQNFEDSEDFGEDESK